MDPNKQWVILQPKPSETVSTSTSREVLRCISSVLNETDHHIYILKKIEEPEVISLIVTYDKVSDNESKFVKGIMIKSGREYTIVEYPLYVSLQIGRFGYDNIGICVYLPE